MARGYSLRIYLLILLAGVLWPTAVFPQYCLDYGAYLRPVWGMDTGNTNQTKGGFISGDYLLLAEGWDGLSIVELVDQSLPIIVATLPLSGNCKEMAASGDIAYVGSGSGWHIVDFSNPALPVLLETRDTGRESVAMQVAGSRAYFLYEDGGLVIHDISDPADPQYLGAHSGSHGVDFVLDGSMIYKVSTGGLHVIDATDPALPVELGSAATAAMAWGVSVSGTHAYVAVDYLGMEIFDVSDPTNPVSLGVTATTDNASDTAAKGETVYVTSAYAGVQAFDVTVPDSPSLQWSMDTKGSSEKVFVDGNNLCILDAYAGFQILDISVPPAPAAARKATPGTLRGAAYDNRYCYVAEGGLGLQIFDVSDPALPRSVQLIGTPQSVEGVLVADGMAYLAESGNIRALDVTDPAAPVFLDWAPANGPKDLFLRDELLFIADYNDGLKIVDISNPANLQQVGWEDTPNWALGVDVAGDFAYVADNSTGLLVIDVSDPANPVTEGTLDLQDFAMDVAVAGGIAFVPEFRLGLAVIDVSVPAAPVLMGHVDTPAPAVGIKLDGTKAYVFCEKGGLVMMDVSDPSAARLTGWFPSQDSIHDIALSNTHVFIADGQGGLAVAAKHCSKPSPVTGRHGVPAAVTLEGAYPNPFNPRTTISFTLVETGPVSLRIFDLSGRLVRVLEDGVLDGRRHQVIWDGRDDAGRSVASSAYIVRLQAGAIQDKRKILLVR